MEIGRVEYNLALSPGQKESFSTDWGLAAVVRSVGRVVCGENAFPTKPNTVVLLAPGCEKRIEATGCEMILDAFEYKGDPGLEENTSHFGYDTYPLTQLLFAMKRERLGEMVYCEDILSLEGQRFFLLLRRLIEQGIHIFAHRLDGLRERIANLPTREWSSAEMIEEAGMSKRQFYNSYLNAFGNTPQQEIILSRIEYAKYLLDTTDLRMTEIASVLHYKSVEHFSRIFKAKCGLSPRNYRWRINRKRFIHFVRPGYLSSEANYEDRE